MSRAHETLWCIACAVTRPVPNVSVAVRLRHPARNRLPRDFLHPG